MTPEVRIHVLFDQTNLETGWDESGQSWRDLHFGGHTRPPGGGGSSLPLPVRPVAV